MKTNFVDSHISNYLKSVSQKNSIIVIKGISLELISQELLQNFFEKAIIINKKIDELQLFDKETRKNFKKTLVGGFEKPVFMSYDVFLYLSNILKDDDLVESSFTILDFSVFSYQKSNFTHFYLDIEDLSEAGESFDIMIYKRIIANSVIVEDTCFVQYIELDSELQKKNKC